MSGGCGMTGIPASTSAGPGFGVWTEWRQRVNRGQNGKFVIRRVNYKRWGPLVNRKFSAVTLPMTWRHSDSDSDCRPRAEKIKFYRDATLLAGSKPVESLIRKILNAILSPPVTFMHLFERAESILFDFSHLHCE